MTNGREMDVARRAKMIEWLKTEILDETARLFRGLWEGRQASAVDSLANLIVSSYLMARRLGINYSDLEFAVMEKLQQYKRQNHQLEAWYGDISSLERHLDGR